MAIKWTVALYYIKLYTLSNWNQTVSLFSIYVGYAIYLLAIQKVSLGGSRNYNVSKVIELMVILNLFYAAFGVISTILAWIDKLSGSSMLESIVVLLGHMTSSVLVPAMVIPLLERMRENVNQDILTEHMSETSEHGSQENSGTSTSVECHSD